ncbi:MAG: MOSC domain-containing protein [Anaerolineae bacterium]|jgi:MOSC domain-containing protein YiiM|nr:MOSC domain-containing protein [Anaerolineae bacterium]
MTEQSGRIASINVAPHGGVPKTAVASAEIATERVVGDKQNNTLNHGGPMRAVCLYSAERIAALRAEGHPILAGSVGENLTLSGVDWAVVAPGGRLVFDGGVEMEVTSYTTPCQKIAAAFSDGDSTRIHQQLHPGWSRVYAKVITPGVVRQGERLKLEEAGR